jgi:hypothetical protein
MLDRSRRYRRLPAFEQVDIQHAAPVDALGNDFEAAGKDG